MAKILVIDDSATVVAALREVLPVDRHSVERLDEPTKLPRLLRSDPPDLILLDLESLPLPRVEFGQAVRRLQRSPTPILIYSSQSEAELARATREVGAVGWIRRESTLATAALRGHGAVKARRVREEF